MKADTYSRGNMGSLEASGDKAKNIHNECRLSLGGQSTLLNSGTQSISTSQVTEISISSNVGMEMET